VAWHDILGAGSDGAGDVEGVAKKGRNPARRVSKRKPRNDPVGRAVKLEHVEKILIIRLRRIGDVVSVTPCTRAVKEAFPTAHLSVLVEKTAEGVMLGNPYVDELIVLDREKHARAGRLGVLQNELSFLLRLRRKRFDLVINLHGGPRSSIQTLASGAKYRLGGFPVRHPWNWVYNIRTLALKETLGCDNGKAHIVLRHLATLQAAGIRSRDPSLIMAVTEAAQVSLDRLLHEQGVRNVGQIVTIHPASRGWTAQWREERFAQLADRLIEEFGVAVVLTSGPREREISRRVKHAMRNEAVDLGGLTSIQEMAALFKRSALFIGLDGGPVHIAAAVGTPLVALYGPTGDIWRPWTSRGVVVRAADPCLGCPKGCPSNPPLCMDAIGVDQVFGAIRDMGLGFRSVACSSS